MPGIAGCWLRSKRICTSACWTDAGSKPVSSTSSPTCSAGQRELMDRSRRRPAGQSGPSPCPTRRNPPLHPPLPPRRPGRPPGRLSPLHRRPQPRRLRPQRRLSPLFGRAWRSVSGCPRCSGLITVPGRFPVWVRCSLRWPATSWLASIAARSGGSRSLTTPGTCSLPGSPAAGRGMGVAATAGSSSCTCLLACSNSSRRTLATTAGGPGSSLMSPPSTPTGNGRSPHWMDVRTTGSPAPGWPGTSRSATGHAAIRGVDGRRRSRSSTTPSTTLAAGRRPRTTPGRGAPATI